MEKPKDPSRLINTELAGCRIVEEIGRGGMAVVYRAQQPKLERWVAIKVLRPDLLAVEEFLTRFRREAKAVAALRHPNILTIYDYGEEQGLAYIVMEYVTGDTLKNRLTGQPWDWLEAVSLILPLGRALAFAHSRGIIHRDIKPANILLARDDWPLLSDFGLAKLLEAQQTLTQPGVGLGTPLYTAPEQMLGEKVDHRADIYALAMLLYEMTTGRLPFEAETPIKLMIERLQRPPMPPRQINPALPVRLEKILLKALEQKPADRFGDMEELVNALDALRRSARRGTATGIHRTTQVIKRDQFLLGPRLIVSGTGVILALVPEKESLIGRKTSYSDQVPDIDLSSHGGGQAGVSRIHARLMTQEGQWYLEDLNSTNGTILNGQTVSPGQLVALKDGDMIQFGSLSVTFYGS